MRMHGGARSHARRQCDVGLMSSVAKAVLVGGLVTPLVVTHLRIFGGVWLVTASRSRADLERAAAEAAAGEEPKGA